MKQLISKTAPCKIKIERAGICMAERTALTHYTLYGNCGSTPGVKTVKQSRITHTWIYEGNLWLLLRGMSCNTRQAGAQTRP